MSAEWKCYRLDDLCDFINGFAFKSSDYVDKSENTIEVFRMGYICRGGGFKEDSTPVFVPRSYRKSLEKYLLKTGDVVIAMTDMKDKVAILGNTARIRHDNRFALNQRVGCIKVRRNDLLCPDFLYFYSNWLPHIENLRTRANSGVQVNLSSSAIKESQLEIPPLQEQQLIATVLLTLDDRITLLRETNATLEAIAQALFKSWFVDFDPVRSKMEGRLPIGMDEATAALFPDSFEESELGLVPRGWSYVSLKEVVSIYDSKRVPLSGQEREKRQGLYPYYGAAALMDFVDDYLFDGIYLLTGEDGSVANASGFSIMQYVWGKFWVNNHAHILQGKAGLATEHVMLALQGINITPYITGAVQAKLSQTNMWRINILKPSLQLSEYFGSILEPLFVRFRHNAEQAQTLSTLRDTLLPRLISGQLRLPDALKEIEGALP
jgi:type I restriction enzyme S subunit